MKNLIFLLVVSLLLISCKSEGVDSSYYNLDTEIILIVKDINGNDLLNPNTTNAYSSDLIKIYYLKENGDIKEVYNPNYDYPRNFRIITPEDSLEDVYVLSLSPNTSVAENAITYIEWNNTEIDTIKTNYRYGENYTTCNEVWYNNINVWLENPSENEGRIIEIIKN